MDLFNWEIKGAEFSECKKYRYALWRIWNKEKPFIMFVGLNPSTANQFIDDPTIKRVVSFSNDWGYGGVYMLNLFPFVTPKPKELIKCTDEQLKINDDWIFKVSLVCEKTIFAWGSFKEAFDRMESIKKINLPDTYALEINNNGTPKHPLYVKGDIQPVEYKL